jgi:carbamoyl-phosphate synthase large subunit
MNTPLCIGVTGMNARPDNPGPGLAVARCLMEAADIDCRIVGLSYDALDPGLYLSDYCDAGYLLPYPSAGEQAFLSRLEEIQQREHMDLLIPCLDAELPGFIRAEAQIRQLGIKTFLPSADQLKLRNKDKLPELAEQAGLHCPRITAITHSRFFDDCQDDGWHYPLVVKGLFYDAKIVYSEQQARAAFNAIAADWGFPVLVQEFVKGQEYNLTALGDGNGHMLSAVMMKKMALTDKGKAWAGVTIDDRTLYQASERLISKINWRGPLEVEVLKDQNGRYQLLEINPRFPAWIYLSHGVGRNIPAALVNLMMGYPQAREPALATGVMFIRYSEEVIIPIKRFENYVVDGMNKT